MKLIPLISLSGALLSAVPLHPLQVDRSQVTKAPELSHLILVVDRSGSMYGDMDAMRKMIAQILTVEDLRDADLLVSLISYSSTGDTTTHFSRVRVGDIMKPSSKERQEIARLEATFLTCISGGLLTAEKLIKAGEPTCLLLHTDGYANDPSPYAEQRTIAQVVDRMSKIPTMVVNTIVYSWGDFALLDMIASRCGGVCVQAKTTKDVFTAIHGSVAVMAGKQSPALRVEAKGMILGVSQSAKKVMVGENELLLRGLSDKDDLEVWAVGEPTSPKNLGEDQIAPPKAILAYARAQLAQGQLNVAKQAMLGLRDTLLYPHRRALTGPKIGEFAAALETSLWTGQHNFVEKFGIASQRPTTVELVRLLNASTPDFQVHMPTLLGAYKKRSIKRVAGIREKNGNLTPPRYKTASKYGDWVSVARFEMNRNAATINMMVTTSQQLLTASGEEVREVGGIPLQLQAFNNYTLIGDGDINVPSLKIRVTDKRLTKTLAGMGFDAVNGIVDLPLGELDVVPVTDVGAELVADAEIVDKLVAIRTVTSMLTAASKGQSSKYTPDQIALLKDHYLSPALNATIPTTNHYADRDEAIRKGWIDSYTSFKIEVGSTKLPTLAELYGANEFVQRHFEVSVKGVKVAKPTMLDVVNPDSAFKGKTPKTPNNEDEAQKPWFDQFMGLVKTGPWNDFLTSVGIEDEDIAEFLGWKKLDSDRRVELFEEVLKKVSIYADLTFSQVLAPTVIFMGATGFLPDAIQAMMHTPESFEQKFSVKLSAKLKEATFFVLSDNHRVLVVRPEVAWYTTQAGLASLGKDVVALEDAA